MEFHSGKVTFKAGVALLKNRRVKVKSGTVTNPPEVEYAGSGEQHIAVTLENIATVGDPVGVRLRNDPGVIEVVAEEVLAVGATLYGAADGKVKDTSTGSAIGVAFEAATADGDIIGMTEFGVLSTTAATVSIADAGAHTAQTEVEAALQEIYQHMLSIQSFIPISLNSLREATNFDVGAIAVNGGILASDTTPTLDAINAATDGCQRILWVASNNDQIVGQIPLPPSLDTTKDLVLHLRIVSGGTTDPVGFTVDTFFNEGDTKVVDTSGTNQTTAYAEVTATIAAADIPAGAQTITMGLTPVAHTTDTLSLTALWLEYAPSILTS